MSRYENALNTVQARTILKAISMYNGSIDSKTDIETACKKIVENMEKNFPAQYPIDGHNGYIAFTLSAIAKYAVQHGNLNILDYLAMLAEVKSNNEKELNDYGAFGDLYEILVRCALMRKLSLVKWSMLSVKDIAHADIVSKKFGVVEVGHNGKTLTFGTMFDYMDGNYESFIYGVFSEDDKAEVYSLLMRKQYEKVIDYICSYSAYWSDKYNFQNDMDNLTRGKGITAKSSGIQIVYNPGKYSAFINALEDGTFDCLSDVLNT